MVKISENNDSNTKNVKQTKAWPLAFQTAVQGRKTFPKSWSAIPVSGSFFYLLISVKYL